MNVFVMYLMQNLLLIKLRERERERENMKDEREYRRELGGESREDGCAPCELARCRIQL